ncbi:hypothetical protein GIB67_021723 [Kingdonia uniflora]|uniref:Transposase MuDR plant domain-containing protein n=1 Tax=Kingdonia uniflora TaxID=39325 RepID=A0A7J7LM56_9MAGN|nr:hypothetical protein GIB67_021723 [Kingdonia uniflora]
MSTNVSLSIKPKPIIGQTKTSAKFWFEPQPKQVKDLLDFQFKSVAYMEDPYGFSKEFSIGDQYRDRVKLKNHIRAYAVVNKFNLEYVLSNEYKIVVHYKGHKCSWQIYATRLLGSALFRVSTYCSMHTCIRVETEGGNAYKAASSRWVAYLIKQKLRKDPNYKPSRIIDDIYGVAYTNHVESWNNVILKVRDLLIHVFIEELSRICSEMSYLYREEAEKSKARLTPWATDHCESRKFMADLLTYRWQTMGIPCEYGVRALGLANVDLTTRVPEYFTNNTYKAVYEPI